MRYKNTLLTTGIIAFTVLLLFSACKKNKNTKPKDDKMRAIATATIQIGEDPSNKFISLTEEGAEKRGDIMGSDFIPPAVISEDGELGLNFVEDIDLESDETGRVLRIKVKGVNKSGNYMLTGSDRKDNYGLLMMPNSNFFTRLSSGGMDGTGVAGKGTLTITSLTKDRVKGTFTMTMYNSAGEKAVVTDGKFDAPLNIL